MLRLALAVLLAPALAFGAPAVGDVEAHATASVGKSWTNDGFPSTAFGPVLGVGVAWYRWPATTIGFEAGYARFAFPPGDPQDAFSSADFTHWTLHASLEHHEGRLAVGATFGLTVTTQVNEYGGSSEARDTASVFGATAHVSLDVARVGDGWCVVVLGGQLSPVIDPQHDWLNGQGHQSFQTLTLGIGFRQ